MMKIVRIEELRRLNNQRKFSLRAYESNLLVHELYFDDPEFAEWYGEQYIVNCLGGEKFDLFTEFDTMH